MYTFLLILSMRGRFCCYIFIFTILITDLSCFFFLFWLLLWLLSLHRIISRRVVGDSLVIPEVDLDIPKLATHCAHCFACFFNFRSFNLTANCRFPWTTFTLIHSSGVWVYAWRWAKVFPHHWRAQSRSKLDGNEQLYLPLLAIQKVRSVLSHKVELYTAFGEKVKKLPNFFQQNFVPLRAWFFSNAKIENNFISFHINCLFVNKAWWF